MTDFENSAISYLMETAEPTPSQWVDQHRRTEESPEKRLLLAVLDDAVRCYIEYHEGGGKWCRSRRLFDEAKLWVEGKWSSPFTFKYVCGELGINPDWLRRGLEAARAAGMRKIAYRENPLRGPKMIAA